MKQEERWKQIGCLWDILLSIQTIEKEICHILKGLAQNSSVMVNKHEKQGLLDCLADCKDYIEQLQVEG